MSSAEFGQSIRTDGDDDNSESSDSSSSTDGETIGTSGTGISGGTDADAKARLRAKIRAQAGSLLNNKGPPVPAVAAVKKKSSGGPRSTSRNIPPAAKPPVKAPVISDDEASDNKPKQQQKTGEQSEESKNNSPTNSDEKEIPESETLTNDQSENSSMHDSKRSMVRFEGEGTENTDVDAAEKGLANKKASFSDEEPKRDPGGRPGLAAFKSVGEDEAGRGPGDEEVMEFDIKEEMTCSDGATLGAALCVLCVITWAIALPITLAIAPDDGVYNDDVTEEPTLLPTLPPVLPTTPPDESPTPAPSLLLEFPPFTQLAFENPDSPQSSALEWLLMDPLVYTYTKERQTQRFALATFYFATNGDEWTDNTNWLDIDNQKHECFWYNQVPVCNDNQEYTILELNNNNLVGFIPPEISLLTSLTEIHLEDNMLSGEIPSDLVNLPSLTFLDLQHNKVTGPLPTELGLLSTLNKLWLNGTRDMDSPDTPATTIPTELAALTLLQELHLASNKLNGQVPSELGLLPMVDWLTLRQNDLTGQIPSEISVMPALATLDLAENQLTGEIPTEIGWLNVTIRQLQLESNGLVGTLPVSMNRLTSVQDVWIYGNNFNGNVPIGLCYFKRIGKVQTIWIDCEELGCECNCECAPEPVVEDVTTEEVAGEDLATVTESSNASSARFL